MTSTSPRYDDLTALYVNCTLKPSPERSNTQGLIDVSAGIMLIASRACGQKRSAPSTMTSRPACGRT